MARFTKGGVSVHYLKNLPLDELNREIATVNEAADQEKTLVDAERYKSGI